MVLIGFFDWIMHCNIEGYQVHLSSGSAIKDRVIIGHRNSIKDDEVAKALRYVVLRVDKAIVYCLEIQGQEALFRVITVVIFDINGRRKTQGLSSKLDIDFW